MIHFMNADNDWVPTPTFLYRNYLYEKIIDKLDNSQKYLLIGIGTGYFLKKLEDRGFKGMALDISKESIARAKKITNINYTKIQFGNILKYRNNQKLSLIFCFEVLEHIKDDQKAISNIYKLLKNKGLFIFSVPAHMSKWGKMDDLGGHFRRYERKEILTKLKKTGFKIQKIWTFGFPFLNFVQFISRSGFFTKNNLDKSMTARTKKSGIRLDYDPKFKFILGNKFLLMPIFKLMDLFVNTNWGLGYLVIAKKSLKIK